jgi:hypothetical protein
MGWYTVTKTIKGRKYLYLQMTYRDGGKVKTKNKYLGPASSKGASFGFGAPANLPSATESPASLRPAGGLRITKIRRLEPLTRAQVHKAKQKAAMRQLELDAYYNIEDGGRHNETDKILRKAYRNIYGRNMRIGKNSPFGKALAADRYNDKIADQEKDASDGSESDKQ